MCLHLHAARSVVNWRNTQEISPHQSAESLNYEQVHLGWAYVILNHLESLIQEIWNAFIQWIGYRETHQENLVVMLQKTRCSRRFSRLDLSFAKNCTECEHSARGTFVHGHLDAGGSSTTSNLPSGKLLHNDRKEPFLMGQLHLSIYKYVYIYIYIYIYQDLYFKATILNEY